MLKLKRKVSNRAMSIQEMQDIWMGIKMFS